MIRRGLVVLFVVIVGSAFIGVFRPEERRAPDARPDPEPVPASPSAPEAAAPEEDLGTIEVVVLDNFDRPLEGCRVRVSEISTGDRKVHDRETSFREPELLQKALTDERGRAALELPPGKEYVLLADRSGSHPAAMARARCPGRTVLHLSRGVLLRGRVLKGDRPAAGAAVRLEPWGAGAPSRATVDTTGRFEITATASSGQLEFLHDGTI